MELTPTNPLIGENFAPNRLSNPRDAFSVLNQQTESDDPVIEITSNRKVVENNPENIVLSNMIEQENKNKIPDWETPKSVIDFINEKLNDETLSSQTKSKLRVLLFDIDGNTDKASVANFINNSAGLNAEEKSRLVDIVDGVVYPKINVLLDRPQDEVLETHAELPKVKIVDVVPRTNTEEEKTETSPVVEVEKSSDEDLVVLESNLEKEIAGLQDAIESGTEVEKFGEENGFDKSKTDSFINKWILADEKTIKKIEQVRNVPIEGTSGDVNLDEAVLSVPEAESIGLSEARDKFIEQTRIHRQSLNDRRTKFGELVGQLGSASRQHPEVVTGEEFLSARDNYLKVRRESMIGGVAERLSGVEGEMSSVQNELSGSFSPLEKSILKKNGIKLSGNFRSNVGKVLLERGAGVINTYPGSLEKDLGLRVGSESAPNVSVDSIDTIETVKINNEIINSKILNLGIDPIPYAVQFGVDEKSKSERRDYGIAFEKSLIESEKFPVSRIKTKLGTAMVFQDDSSLEIFINGIMIGRGVVSVDGVQVEYVEPSNLQNSEYKNSFESAFVEVKTEMKEKFAQDKNNLSSLAKVS
jgi:hypothetical protein